MNKEHDYKTDPRTDDIIQYLCDKNVLLLGDIDEEDKSNRATDSCKICGLQWTATLDNPTDDMIKYGLCNASATLEHFSKLHAEFFIAAQLGV